ncbi:MAG: tRNA 2-thiouridine(34) synthase MnmA [Oscillospiraceae bacterium]|nr:tRNA 2-thiouridine(34) synthase MnmA [Oscillospiraceae bacterium]
MKKILVGMSGGVDSSVAALLLKRQGYEADGCTLKLFDGEIDEDEDVRTCCSVSDIMDAKSVCRKLGIEHYVFNFKDLFRQRVMDAFAQSYIDGETPNPCINCNRYIKFGAMLNRAAELGYDGIATGHYADVRYNEESGRWLLMRSADRRKDQTYVLYNMTQSQLSRTLFPLCNMDKQEIRRLAEENGLINARKPDSQDICFVPDGDYASFIATHTGRDFPCGNYIDTKGNIIGTHRGYIHYTIGQRKGLGAAFGEPMFVCGKNPTENTVTLGKGEELMSEAVIADDVNLISIPEIKTEMRITAKIRYNMTDAPGTLTPCGDSRIQVKFDSPVRAAARGQALVIYDGDKVVGGGRIV